jgi:hypothetical protein
MSNPNPYAELGVSEDASFEEVRSARDALLASAPDEARQQEIEAAYDAVLMDRLRARKEGRIAVPDRIRYAENMLSNPVSSYRSSAPRRYPQWLTRSIYSPTLQEVITAGAIFGGLWIASVLIPANINSVWVPLALFGSIFLINRRGKRFGMSVLFAVGTMVLGYGLAWLMFQIPVLQFGSFPNSISTLLILVLMGLASLILG